MARTVSDLASADLPDPITPASATFGLVSAPAAYSAHGSKQNGFTGQRVGADERPELARRRGEERVRPGQRRRARPVRGHPQAAPTARARLARPRTSGPSRQHPGQRQRGGGEGLDLLADEAAQFAPGLRGGGLGRGALLLQLLQRCARRR